MTPRERELLEAARPMLSASAKELVQNTIEAEYVCGDRRLANALAFLLNNEDTRRKAVAAYTDNPQADHEACLARRVAEDGPPPVTDAPGFDGRDGGRHHPISSGAE